MVNPFTKFNSRHLTSVASHAVAMERPRPRWSPDQQQHSKTNRSRHSPIAEYTVKKPPPEAVGITEFINPLALGGELRVRIKDWEVREVGADFTVARLKGEPKLNWWAEVERKVSAGARDEPDSDSSDESSFPALDGADKTKAVEDAHWEGVAMTVVEARSYIEQWLGHTAITQLDAFLCKAMSSSLEVGVLRAKLGEATMSDEDAYRLRGAIVAATKHMLVNVPCKFEGRGHRVFCVAENRGFKKLLLQHMTLSDAQKLLGLITCGYGQRDVEFTFRSPGPVVDSDVDSFATEVAKFWRDLAFEIVESDQKEGLLVRAKWSRVYSQRGLHGGKRWRCVLHKANLDTPRVLAMLEKKLRLPRESIHYAGLKDKRGLTYHNCFRIRLRGVEPGSSSAVESLRKTGFINYFGLQRFGWDKGDGASSHVYTGAAIITRDFNRAVRSYLRPLADDISEDAQIRRAWLETGDAHKAAEALAKASTRDNRDISLYRAMLLELATCRDKGRHAMMLIPKTLWHLLAASYVSCLWNRLASQRIREGGLRVTVGDLVEDPTSRELRLIRSEEDSAGYTIHDVRLPQLGEQVEGECRVLTAGVNVEELYAKLIRESEERGEIQIGSWSDAKYNFSDLGFNQKLTTIPRRLVVRPTALLAAEESNGERLPYMNNLLLDFHLPRGSYATMLLREIMEGRN
ncbi:tRNA pseudouridine synthase D, putative [Perkinsus marinus ATCC 50983]|uniref:tRNA pseudouridine synthase D, putative n=1 Tax=Perkinsus marinus (strain ATCC 50983 / TXsc) TaxID=423536 RepID=C5KJY8_PERM5|nr:tRNA pseudouridine synthase D, putative [Perkinsus marinus ATCC 50983]EER15246.1 tRNA pseudouridine synthase D, putative [Perkinsus marinus ATCC 50983]|eukprot:XP_002783450.1 tRNA pseudouridine synthase D, putative [Perkinsus marinus ATCC 50983]